MIYLASPYSDESEAVRHMRFELACYVAGVLMERGHVVFSPIAHTHPIAKAISLPTDWTFWEKQDRAMLERCDEVYVLKMQGWKQSRGVQAEIAIARELGKPVRFVEASEFVTEAQPA